MDQAGAFVLGAAAGVLVTGVGAALYALLRRPRATRPATPPRPAVASGPATGGTPVDAATPLGGGAALGGDAVRDGTVAAASAGLAGLHTGVLVLGAGGRVVLANPAARRLGLVRTVVDPAVPPGPSLTSGPPGTATGARSAGRGGTTEVAHATLRTLAGRVTAPGQRRDVDLQLSRRDVPDAGDGGGLLGVRIRLVGLDHGLVLAEAEDVTEAHRVARVRRDFVANVSHELKTPVGALQLLAEALIDALDDPAAAHRFAERIAHESGRLGRLVGELLELSRLQGADPLPEPAPVRTDRIVAEAVDRTRTTAQAHDIAVRVADTTGRTVYGDETQLVTALANLVENAVAYSAAGTVVCVRVDADADAVTIAVTDQGIGIDPADLDRIFERFYRADKARSRVTGGTGLGLAIVKHIATNHGGSVTVASALGAGSTFTLRLPARPPGTVAVAHHPADIAADLGAAVASGRPGPPAADGGPRHTASAPGHPTPGTPKTGRQTGPRKKGAP